MKFIRLGALFGSIVLLVATSITMLNKRTQLRDELDDRVTAAAFVATESVQSTVGRATAVVDVAAASADVNDGTLEALVLSMDGASACAIDATGERCTGASLFATEAFDTGAELSAANGGRAVVIADESADSVLVVAAHDVTVALQLPASGLVSDPASQSISKLDATAAVSVSSAASTQPGVDGPDTSDGEVAVTTTIGLPAGAPGGVVVRTTMVDDIGFFGQNLALYGVLLGLGTVLIALAGGTFFAERRSLERRATTDELTGLVNRREFERMSDVALFDASRFGTGLCVMLVDLNGFKQINDTLGHQFGDLVLQACADRLLNAVRDTDVVGRWGGDEFVILLPGLEDGSAVRRSAERIAGQLSATPVVGDVSISGAIGAALYPRHGETLDELMRAADVAMYEAKSSGVTHRVADAVTLEFAGEAASDQYRGPERRRQTSRNDVDQLS